MKKRTKHAALKFPNFSDAVSQLPPPELSMDDYYKAVVMVRQAMPCWPEAAGGGNERFVIRDEGEECPPKKPD